VSVFTGVSAALGGAGRREAEEFADLLERDRVPAGSGLADLVVLARSLAPADRVPSDEFRAALRERLVAEAAARPLAVPAPRAAETAPAPTRIRVRQAVAALAIASVVAGAGAAAASTRALPGDALYGLKRQIENVQLALAGSDLERGRELLEQADNRLSEAERLAASEQVSQPGTRHALSTVLEEMRVATEAGSVALTEAYEETGDEEPMLLLDRFVTDQRERLEDLYALLGPSLRARIAALVDDLERVGATARAVVSATSAAAPVGDGWAVSRLDDRVSGAPGDLAGAPAGGDPVGAVGGAAGTGPGTGAAGGDGGLLGDLVGDVTGGVSAPSPGSSAGPGAGGGGGPGGGSSTLPSLPAPPLPTASAPPLPTASAPPLPTLSPPPAPSVPLPSPPQVSQPQPSPVCLPPLTNC
jgi:hypothetical protein